MTPRNDANQHLRGGHLVSEGGLPTQPTRSWRPGADVLVVGPALGQVVREGLLNPLTARGLLQNPRDRNPHLTNRVPSPRGSPRCDAAERVAGQIFGRSE